MTENTAPPGWYGPDCVRCGQQCTQCWFELAPGNGEYACFKCITDEELAGNYNWGAL